MHVATVADRVIVWANMVNMYGYEYDWEYVVEKPERTGN